MLKDGNISLQIFTYTSKGKNTCDPIREIFEELHIFEKYNIRSQY